MQPHWFQSFLCCGRTITVDYCKSWQMKNAGGKEMVTEITLKSLTSNLHYFRCIKKPLLYSTLKIIILVC